MSFLPLFLALMQVMLIDLSMAGDNALVVGMAAAGLPQEKRHKAVLAGIIGATILRIIFALFAVQILHITGLLVAGGLLLLWVGWKMFVELGPMRKAKANKATVSEKTAPHEAPKRFSAAIWQIIVADVSMSLDNVLGVAGVARDHIGVLVAGLALSVMLMGLASSFVARLAGRYSWIGYVGLLVVLYTAAQMIADGLRPILTL